MSEQVFAGFSPAALSFLRELGANIERGWFVPRKQDYETLLRDPLRRLVDGLAPSMLAIDPRFDVGPKSAAVSRILRDVRFSRDKSPYRINQWVAFKVRTEGWPSRPAYFMEFGPSGYRYGMGFYGATPAIMAAVRTAILGRSARFLAASAAAEAGGFRLVGDDAYKRPRLPPDQPAAVLDWFRLKSPYLERRKEIDAVFFSPALADELRMAFAAAAPLYHFLEEAIRPPAV